MAEVQDIEEEDETAETEEFYTKKVEQLYEADMRTVLGYLNQSEWIQNINIGNIM
jgi:hypothetical protein